MSLYNRLISQYNRLMSLYNRLTETGPQKINFFLRDDFRPLPNKKSRIWETKHLSTDADSSTDAIEGWTKAKSAQKKNFFLRGNFRPLPNKNVQMLDHFFPKLFPKDSESLKIFDIRLRELGAKRLLNSEQTDRQTHKHTHIWTFRLIESIGPEGRCFENYLFFNKG